MERWRHGPMEEPARPRLQPRSSPQIFNVRPWTEADGADLGRPDEIAGIEVSQRLRTRRDAPGALVLLADGRYAVTGDLLVAVGPRRQIAAWAGRRVGSAEGGAAKAWWQEVAGVLNAPAGG